MAGNILYCSQLRTPKSKSSSKAFYTDSSKMEAKREELQIKRRYILSSNEYNSLQGYTKVGLLNVRPVDKRTINIWACIKNRYYFGQICTWEFHQL